MNNVKISNDLDNKNSPVYFSEFIWLKEKMTAYIE